MRSRVVVAILPVVLLLSWSLGAAAQERADARARRALDALDPAACRPSTGFDARLVPLAVVVHPGGSWALAVGPTAGNGVVDPQALSAFSRCLEAALAAALPQPLPRAPRVAAVVARTWTIPTPAELWVDQRLVAIRAATYRCVAGASGHARPIRARVRVARDDAGTTTVTPTRPSAAARVVATCLAQLLGPLPDDLEPLEREVSSEAPAPVAVVEPPSEPLEGHDGRAGAICRWGERRGDVARLPAPRDCRAGLHCCAAGGAAGSDSTCIPASGPCPMYP